MNPPTTFRPRLEYLRNASFAGLALAERRVASPRATVIFVHGALDRAASFSRIARRLDEFDVVAYDRRGYQGSRDLAPLDLDHHVDDLLSVINREVPERAVILFGHSFGGVVTWGAAARDPSRVALVINYESPFPWLLGHEHPRPALNDDPAREAEEFFRRVVSNDAWERLSAPQRESRQLDGPALLADLRTIRVNDAPYSLASLRTPSTYVYGDDARSTYYHRLAQVLAAINPVITTLESAGSDHSAHLRDARKLSTLVVERWGAVCASE